jgi:tRNA 2-thiocytidine biosynthesis protein TtcA
MGTKRGIAMREMTFAEEVERSILKKYKGTIYGKFLRAIDDYQLIQPGDKIAVAMSGGKDSLLMAKLFQEAKRHSGMEFELVFLMMDPGFVPELVEQFKANCERLAIPVVIESSRIFDVLQREAPESPCFLCARMRRGSLYHIAKKHGCNKLALGHHFNDVIETTLLNVFYAGQFKTMLPKARSENYEGMELIRPMYLVKEEDIVRFTRGHQIEAMQCGCTIVCTEGDSKRLAIKNLIKEWRKSTKDLDISIFRAAENVNLHNVLGYYNNDEALKKTFLDDY